MWPGRDVPGFYDNVERWLNTGIFYLAMALMIWAFIHVLTQKPDKFAALGGLQRHHWLLILSGLFLFSWLGILGGVIPFLYIGIGAAAYYLLETRRGLKDVSEGHW